MEVEEAKKKKIVCEQKILQLLLELEQETGIKVEAIEFLREEHVVGFSPSIVSSEVKIYAVL